MHQLLDGDPAFEQLECVLQDSTSVRLIFESLDGYQSIQDFSKNTLDKQIYLAAEILNRIETLQNLKIGHLNLNLENIKV